jgi:SulP family sulfate permease
MSQSLVNEGSGARTPLSGAIASIFILIVVLFLSHQLSALPQPVLAAVVLMAIAGLFQVTALKQLWFASRAEFVVAIAALLGVLGSGLLRGVMIGAAISLVQLMQRTSRPHVALLGQIPGTRRFSDMERHPDNEATPGALVFRPESSLVYFNIEHVCMTILDRVRQAPAPPRLVVLDLSAAPYVDLQSAHALAALADELGKAGSTLQVVEARSGVRDRLQAEGLAARLGGINRFSSVADALERL